MDSKNKFSTRGRPAVPKPKSRGKVAYNVFNTYPITDSAHLPYYEDPNMSFVGKRLREERNRLHYTQEEVAEMIGVTPAYIGHMERGERGFSIETLVKLCNAYGTTIDYLFTDVIKHDKNSVSEQICLLLRDKTEEQQKAILDIMKAVARNI